MESLIRKYNPTPGDLHINQALTNLSIKYLQDDSAFIADRVFPSVGVNKQSDKYWIYDRKGTNVLKLQKRAPHTRAARIEATRSTDSYYLDVMALGAAIDDQERANTDIADLDTDYLELLARQVKLQKEYDFASNFFTAGKWGTDFTAVIQGTPSSSQFLCWNDANSDPIGDVKKAVKYMLENTGYKPNKLTLGYNVWDSLRDHPDLIDRLKYGGQITNTLAKVTREMVAALLEIPEILVSEAIYDTKDTDPDTEDNTFIMGNHALLTYSQPSPGLRKPSAGYTFFWTAAEFYGSMNGFRVKRYRDEPFNSDIIEIQGAYTQKQTGADLGILFVDAYKTS